MNQLDHFFTPDSAAFAKRYFAYLARVLDAIDTDEIDRFIRILLDARERGAKILFIGNGGSASTASHFANDLSIGTRCPERPFRAISLTDNLSIITAVGNDYGYHDIFVRQLRTLAKPGDVLVGISASGNSPNILEAFAFARASGLTTVALTAFDGGKMRPMADAGVHVPTQTGEYGPAEDGHMILDHLVTGFLMRLVAMKNIDQ